MEEPRWTVTSPEFVRDLWLKVRRATVWFLAVVGALCLLWQLVAMIRISPAHRELILTLVDIAALMLAIWAILYARSHLKEMRLLQKDVNDVAKSMTTRHIGSFPEHLVDIVALIMSASSTIDILADCVDYGSFFAPQLHGKVLEAISLVRSGLGDKKSIVNVRILVCGEPQAITHNSPFWGLLEATDNDEWAKSADKFKNHLEKYLDNLNSDRRFKEWLARCAQEPNKEAELTDWLKACESKSGELDVRSPVSACLSLLKEGAWSSFGKDQKQMLYTLLQSRQKWFADRLDLGGVVIKWRKKDNATLFTWIKDYARHDQEAVFMFTDVAQKTRGLGFRTSDPKLLEIFRETFDSRYNHAKDSPGETA